MNHTEKSIAPSRRFVQVGLLVVLAALVTSGVIALQVLRAESAKASITVLAGGLFWIAILLWGILFVQLMAFLNTKCRPA